MALTPTVLAVIELQDRARTLEYETYKLQLLLSDCTNTDHLQSEIKRLRWDRDNRYQECKKIQAQLDNMIVREALVSQERDELRVKVTSGNRRSHTSEREIKELRRELDQARASAAQHADELVRVTTSHTQKISQLESDLASSRTRNQQAVELVREVESERRDMEKRGMEAIEAVETAQRRTENIRRKLEKAQEEIQSYKTVIKTMVLKPGSAQVRYIPPSESDRESLLRNYDITIIAAHNSLAYFGKRNLMLRQHVKMLTALLVQVDSSGVAVDRHEELEPHAWDDFINHMPEVYQEKRMRLRENLCETTYNLALVACENIGMLFKLIPIDKEPQDALDALIDEKKKT